MGPNTKVDSVTVVIITVLSVSASKNEWQEKKDKSEYPGVAAEVRFGHICFMFANGYTKEKVFQHQIDDGFCSKRKEAAEHKFKEIVYILGFKKDNT